MAVSVKVLKSVVAVGKVLAKGAVHKLEDDIAQKLIDDGYVAKAKKGDEEPAAPEKPAAPEAKS